MEENHPERLPWTPLTEKGREKLAMAGLLYKSTFQKHVKQESKMMFDEFRLMGFYGMASRLSMLELVALL